MSDKPPAEEKTDWVEPPEPVWEPENPETGGVGGATGWQIRLVPVEDPEAQT